MKLANQKMDLSGFEALDTNYNDKIDTDEATHVLDITGMAISVVEFPAWGRKGLKENFTFLKSNNAL